MKSSWSNCWSVVDPKHWTTLALCPAPFPIGAIPSSSLLYLHLLQVFVSGVLIAMVLHLAQMPLLRGEHRVDLWKKHMILVKETLPGLIPQNKRQQTNTEWIPWWAVNGKKGKLQKVIWIELVVQELMPPAHPIPCGDVLTNLSLLSQHCKSGTHFSHWRGCYDLLHG